MSDTFSLQELTACTGMDQGTVVAFVQEGILEVQGRDPGEWAFSLPMLMQARRAWRLQEDLELSPAGVALALQLLEEVRRLHARLRRFEFLTQGPTIDL